MGFVVTVVLLALVGVIMFAIKIPMFAIFLELFRYARRTGFPPWDAPRKKPNDKDEDGEPPQ